MAEALSSRFRSALVTGASSGLGAAIASMLVREGVEVWGTSRDPARVPPPLRPVRLDLADGPAAAAAMVAQVEAETGGTDLLVHCAGSGVFGRFAATDFEQWKRQLEELGVTGAAVLHAQTRAMVGRGRGAIVCVSSMAAEFPIPFMAGYNAAKAAQSSLTESLMMETAASAIQVVDFRAGDFRTRFNDAMKVIPGPATDAAWRRNLQLMRGAPEAARAARDLLGALRGGRSRVVRSGGLFQTGVAPFLARFAPRSWHLAVIRRYYGIR